MRFGVLAVTVAGLAMTAVWNVQGAGAQAAGGGVTETLPNSKAVFERVCSGCHGLDRPLAKTLDKPAWEALVDRMRRNGASLTAEEQAQIVSYLLTKNVFEAKCSVCHGTDRPLGKSKSAADWLATVERMAGKKPGHLTAAEIAEIAAYLSLVRPARK